MKIAFITHQFPPSIGGMQQWNRQMAQSYAAAGHSVTVFHLRYGTRPHAASLYRYVPVTVDSTVNVDECQQPRNSLRVFMRTAGFFIRSAADLARHDVWQVTFGELMPARLIAAAAAQLAGKTLIAASGCVVFRQRYGNAVYRQIALLLNRAVLRAADLILVDGEDIRREFMERRIDARRIRVCYAGVDTQLFSPARDEQRFRRLALARGARLLPGCKTALYCCRFSHENAPFDFLDAIDRVAGIQGVMAGDGPLNAAVRVRAGGMRTPVHFLGALAYEDLPLVFSSADVCLYPFSRYIGGISQVIPLSMACGATVVTTDIGDNRALIDHGKNGFLAGEGDHASMARLLEDVVSGRADACAIGIAARQTIVERWSIGRRDAEYRRLLEELAHAMAEKNAA